MTTSEESDGPTTIALADYLITRLKEAGVKQVSCYLVSL